MNDEDRGEVWFWGIVIALCIFALIAVGAAVWVIFQT